MNKIIIEFDIETKQISKVEGTEDMNAVDIAKVLITVGMNALNRIDFKKKTIVEPDKKIIKPQLVRSK